MASDAADEVIDGRVVERLAREIAEARAELGTEIAVVIGGGNIWRGATGSATGMDRATADYMGMLATVINALAAADALERRASPPGSKPRSACRSWQSRTSACGPYGTWRRVGS